MDNINDCYVWQCRIRHGIRYQKVALPFPESVKIGLEFNTALERKEKLDQCLLTNAVMLEICDFAKTVTKSEKYFLFEMLEFNFDLGVDVNNDMQCYEYATRVQSKIKQLKEQMKQRPRKWAETFPLPDPNLIKEFTMSEVQGRYYPKRNRIADISVLTDGSKNGQCPENQNSTFVIKRKGRFRLKLAEDVYPFCRKLGVTLTVRPDEEPKQKLDPNLVTIGVMMELLDFSRALCGSYTQIINDLVKHNFGQELDRLQFRMQLNKLMERKYACLTAEDRDAFRRQTFTVQKKKREQRHKKRKNPDTDFQELEKLTVVSKRRETLRHRDRDLSYMCPVDSETDTQSGPEVGPEKKNHVESQSTAVDTKLAVSLDVKQEEEEVFICAVQPQMDDNNSCWLNFHPNNRTVKTDADLFSEGKDINTKTPKQKVWMRRAARSKQILKSSRVNDMFARSREIRLDFNVGSGSKQNLDLQLLTNWVLWEVFKFATAMTKSVRSFLLDVLDNNFNLAFRETLQLRNFTFYVMTKEKVLQSHPARQKTEFLSSPFQFPEVYNMVNVTSGFQSEQELEAEQQADWDLSGSATNQQADVALYPFCAKLGLNLWSTQERPPSQKLDLTVLTTGAVLEIFSFIRGLCGSVRETVADVLEHNFDLDLQSGATEAAQVIQRWFVTQKSLMKNQNMSPKISRWLNTVVPLSPQPSSNGLKRLDAGDFNFKSLTKASSYHICQKIGLDLDVSSKSENKTKLDLQVLTRGVLFEVHEYVEQNCNQYVPALYEILDYNFDLSSQSHRKVEFAWSIASQVIAMVGKNGRKVGYLNTVFELPMEACESSQVVCKDEPDDGFGELDLNDHDHDILFIRKLKPVDIEVEIE
ncbi:uncharacterized protein LOC113160289 [Anabas testudineus]|uniref:uncharacterized protein LOC113160289 n=1 Tax=Anabas testudineus TaxID=64144 RepID=UPI000E45DC69|nr:uncharacterized protein LOC113160289 [Anabas testudineus]